ncbi:hypothetical protein DEK44_21140 [Salmonella enterica]|nr:hypothetical protein [Salmonella enterica]EHF5600736.1 hypothetical protein [Salmonella enterica subsp. enterica serovar Muenchen]ECF9695814.1 hypothetical protein [Salmonella enterica]ECK6616368.1 hypothetical protein [Salmonella enterica]ECZ0517448.1 hypothetical protein [Salmonella enterica]
MTRELWSHVAGSYCPSCRGIFFVSGLMPDRHPS